jgi:hypothetical protein
MADTFANSYDASQPNMIKYPQWLQATGGDAAINYAAQDDRELLSTLFPVGGPLTPADFQMTQRGAGANFSVDISAGRCAVVGTTSTEQGTFLTRTTGVVNLTTPSAPGSGATRTHRVVAEILDKQAAGSLYGWRFHLLEDTGSGEPAAPASSFTLGTVSIAVGQGSVLNANITNQNQFVGISAGRPSVCARFTASSGNTIPNNTDTVLTFQGVDWDTDPLGAMWSAGTPYIITVRRPGLWLIEVESNWAANATGVRSGKVQKNVAGSGSDNTKTVLGYNVLAANANETLVTACKRVRLATGDTLRLDYFQNSGSGVNIVQTVGASACAMGNALTATWVSS